jgi:RNA polymerase sigma factor (sigma-70 family)
MASLHNVVDGFAAGEPRRSTANDREFSMMKEKSVEPPLGSGASGARALEEQPFETRFEAIFLAHYTRVVAVLRRIVGDQGRAEELASEVFLKLYRQSGALDLAGAGSGNVGGWLYRTATNLGIDALRAAARRSRLEQAAARSGTSGATSSATSENGLELAQRTEREQRVRGVLADLKPAQAQLLLLRASGHSYKELASALEIEAGSVGTLLVRAEAAFEQHYVELFGREEDV